jgi:hypothetical protein
MVIGYIGTSNKIRVADTYDGLPVTKIYRRAFMGLDLVEIILPNGIVEIEYQAFKDCNKLVSVYLGNNLQVIADSAFSYCSKLININIPTSVVSVGVDAFKGCYNMSYTLYDNCRYLGNQNNLYLVLINASENCTTYSIHETTKVIADAAFYDCSRLMNIEIPQSIVTIGDSAFTNCTLLEKIIIPDNVTSLGIAAFRDCSRLESVMIGNGVTYLSGTFANCTSLKKIIIPDSVTEISLWTFSGCEKLKEVVLGKNVKTVGYVAFDDYGDLEIVYYRGTEMEWRNIEIDSTNKKFNSSQRYYFSEYQPLEEGNYWHYVDGVPTPW